MEDCAIRRVGVLTGQLRPAPTASSTDRAPVKEDVEACIIGMGFSGMALNHKLREAGVKRIRSFEIGDDVGGTWYWNRYPGAACDIESYSYSFSFSSDLEQEWSWSRRYGKQPEILKYAHHAADKFNLRENALFNTEVTSITLGIASGVSGTFFIPCCLKLAEMFSSS